MIILDASAALELVLNTHIGRGVAERIADPAESLHAPHLLTVEVTQVLRRYVLSRFLSEDEGRAALRDLVDLGVELYEHEPLLPRAWDWRELLTAYDGVYVALAEALDSPLVTSDRRLARGVADFVRVELLE